LNNLISIEQARKAKGVSIDELSKALKIDRSIIKCLEEGLELPKKFKSYQKSYTSSIYRYLGYSVEHSTNLKAIPEDNTKMILTIFFFLFSFFILISLSINIYSNFNSKISIKVFQKDKIYEEVERHLLSQSLEYIDHKNFLQSLEIKNRVAYNNNVIFEANTLPIYYKLHHLDNDSIQFGEILPSKSLILDLNDNFLIDISNISYIDKIIYEGVEIKLNNKQNLYLKEFNVNEIDQLL
tara:strand:- start:8931 stop:9647 length:717 start_codon:yes stop_codon:yes gene_type:complete